VYLKGGRGVEGVAFVIRLGRTVPALPVTDVARSLDFYRGRLGFEPLHRDGGFAVLRRDDAIIHLWEAADESWREQLDPARPVRSGAESFIAGTASCRIETEGVSELYPGCRDAGIVHPRGELQDTDFGTTEFSVLDPDNNLVSFYAWR
jgi:catechol 2,3-dioxygenase-like lactoylglutathione lyase family enzyme